ncbi:uncharacterized protein LOC122289297 [Carya illinoinensis]|uniref:uncharacterized protein LOC122289297 n=1 Tax=Carya illinoinensis TaxID=32201 RepID=UPI001C721F65|nr:uncharacterized protein LOC122289297 [Carya illinoinensis]
MGADILFWEAFVKMGIDVGKLRLSPTPLKGFSGHTIQLVGAIMLPVTAGTGVQTATTMTDFLIVKAPSSYNAILGRPTLNHLRAVTSTYHLKMKFPTDGGMGEARGEQALARECYVQELKKVKKEVCTFAGQDGTLRERDIEVRDDQVQQHAEFNEPLELVTLYADHPGTTTRIGTQVPLTDREALIKLLIENRNVFTWSHEEMPGIDNDIIEHYLGVDPSHKAVRQKRRSFSAEKYAAISEEVEGLLAAGSIRETHYPEWLSNVFLVKKANGKWRICYSGVSYVELYGHIFGLQLDTDECSGQRKDIFHHRPRAILLPGHALWTEECKATYQRLVNRMFREQIGKSMEVYVDDLLVKSKEPAQHLLDLRTAFGVLHLYRMRLNPSKCAFGIQLGKFLGFILSERGIEASPDKIEAIINMKLPQNLNETQRLAWRVAALGRFIARSTDKCLPFLQLLLKVHPWNEQ